ncbi:MAG TPA: TylF/MycF/NovP-related O-methyltransferase, partial [Planctomycetota bacterium]|nr:TylF/MycF/NovP-related O-methyltransferase [Planctomycetota bacterium]
MRIISAWLRSIGVKKPRWEKKGFFPVGFGEDDKRTYIEVHPFTMTDRRRILALLHAVKYLERCRVPGDVVECGVWKGGSMMAVARTLLNAGSTERTLYLFDTYEGMTE